MDFEPDFLRHIFPRINWGALREAAAAMGELFLCSGLLVCGEASQQGLAVHRGALREAAAAMGEHTLFVVCFLSTSQQACFSNGWSWMKGGSKLGRRRV